MKNPLFILLFLVSFLTWQCTNAPAVEGEAEPKVVQLTSGKSDESNIQYSPDGQYILYARRDLEVDLVAMQVE